MPIPVAEQEVIETLRKVVAKYPDRVYVKQLYVDGDEPGCVVAHVLYRLGVTLAELAQHENEVAQGLVYDLLDTGLDVADTLREVQYRQDQGMTWRQALEAAGV
jgi:hypothetical protein